MSDQYDRYLDQHRRNVRRGLEWLVDNLPDLFSKVDLHAMKTQILNHDASKNSPEEYAAYDRYFYGGNKSFRVVQDFRKAWLHHIHENPHHWQHWVLNNDEPEEGEVVLEMDYIYIIEMICDWWAFSWQKGDLSEIFSWYDKHQKYIKLAPNTRKTVEDILWTLRGRLGYNVLAHHGIKGQKWGVRNGPPYPLDKSQKSDTIVEDAIESGEVIKTINREKQLRHTKSNHAPGRSYLDGDLDYAQELVDRHSGKGSPIRDRNGNWTHQERIDNNESIGSYVDRKTMEETKTSKGIIVYSKTGTHIYPAKDERSSDD